MVAAAVVIAVRHASFFETCNDLSSCARIAGVKGRFVSLPRQTPFSFWVKPRHLNIRWTPPGTFGDSHQ